MALARPTPPSFSLASSPRSSRTGLSYSYLLPRGLHTSGSSSFVGDGFQSLVLQHRQGEPGHRRRGGLNVNALFGLGVPELVVIAGVAALIFGPKQLPEIGKSLGKTMKSFQQAAKEFESEIKQAGGDSASADASKPEVFSSTSVSQKEKESTEV